MAYGVEAADITNLTNWLKDQYHGPQKGMLATFNTENFWFDSGLFDRKIETKLDGGNQFVYPLQSSRNTGWGSRAENNTLPAAKASTKRRIRGTLRLHTQRYRFSGLGQARARLDKFAYFDAMKSGLKDVPKDFAKFMSQAMWRDGTGVVARINDAAPLADTTITLDGNMTTGSGETFGGDHLHDEMDIAVWRGAAAKTALASTAIDLDNRYAAGERSIESVDSETQITIDSAFVANVADNDWITWSVDRANNQVPSEVTGMLAHINDTGTVHNTNKATNRWFQAAFRTGAAGDAAVFSLNDVDTHLRTIVHTVGSSRVKHIALVSRPAMASRIFREIQDNVRFAAKELDRSWGWSSFDFTRYKVRVSLIEDADCPAGCLWYITPSSFGFHQSFDPKIADEDGLTWRNIAGTWTFEMMYVWDCEAVNYNPRFNGVRKGYAE